MPDGALARRRVALQLAVPRTFRLANVFGGDRVPPGADLPPAALVARGEPAGTADAREPRRPVGAARREVDLVVVLVRDRPPRRLREVRRRLELALLPRLLRLVRRARRELVAGLDAGRGVADALIQLPVRLVDALRLERPPVDVAPGVRLLLLSDLVERLPLQLLAVARLRLDLFPQDVVLAPDAVLLLARPPLVAVQHRAARRRRLERLVLGELHRLDVVQPRDVHEVLHARVALTRREERQLARVGHRARRQKVRG
mmetsp:Transcript_12723/g.39559  ORF Transcript_12723/g.39559 Transcript_12723/m.39559 type:complete len:259 (-) Transcript_12723:29-805(-)